MTAVSGSGAVGGLVRMSLAPVWSRWSSGYTPTADHGLATARGRLLAQIRRLIDNPPPLEDAELAVEFPALFTLRAWTNRS